MIKFYFGGIFILALALLVSILFLFLFILGGGSYAMVVWGKLMIDLLGGPRNIQRILEDSR